VRNRQGSEHAPVSAKTLAMGLPEEAWRIVGWWEGGDRRSSVLKVCKFAEGREAVMAGW